MQQGQRVDEALERTRTQVETKIGGGVKQDKLFLLARVGFESFELPPGENPAEALAALKRYDVVYQPGAPVEGIRRQRLFA